MRKTATELGIAVRTVFKYVNEDNASLAAGGHLRPEPLKAVASREIAREIDKLGVSLPRSTARIATLLGDRYPKDAIRYFLKSRAKVAEGLLRESGNLLDKPHLQLRDIYGRTIPVGYFEMYQISLDWYTLNVTIEATLKFGGKVTCRMSFEAFRDLLKTKGA
jgi:hypothetical protein